MTGIRLWPIRDTKILSGFVRVSESDERFLLPEERLAALRYPRGVRAQQGAARHLVKSLFRRMGVACGPLPHRFGKPPEWPAEWVASITHSDGLAAAAVAPRSLVQALGIDVEPLGAAGADIFEAIASRREREIVSSSSATLLFCAKEAAYKTVFGLTGQSPEPTQIEVNLIAGIAQIDGLEPLTLRTQVANGHALAIAYALPPRLAPD